MNISMSRQNNISHFAANTIKTSRPSSSQPHYHSPSSDAAGTIWATSAGKVGGFNSWCINPHRQKLEALSPHLLLISQLLLLPFMKISSLLQPPVRFIAKGKKRKRNISPQLSLGVHVFLLLVFCLCLRR